MDWRKDAVCPSVDPELFFPVGTAGPAKSMTKQAKLVCAGCPVRAECLAEALATQPYGIWGGTSEYERTRIRRASRQAGQLSPAA